jgi:hypothetical protein
MFRDIVNPGYGSPFTVAFAAQHGDIHFIGSRVHISRGKDVVFSMAFTAGWGVRSASPERPTVYPGVKGFLGHIMTHSAGNLFQLLGMGKILHISILMAVDAFQALMNRAGKLGKIDVKLNRAPQPGCSQVRIGMTGFAVLIALSRSEIGPHEQSH